MSGVTGMPPATPAKTPKRKSKLKKTGPCVSDLIVKVVSGSKDRSGVSLAALKKSLAATGYNVSKNNAQIKLGVRRLVANEGLLQPKGTGASGSFKINNRQPAAKKGNVAKKKAKSPRKAKRASPMKVKFSKSPARKRRKAKSPKRAKKPAAAKKPKSPNRTKRRVSRSARAKVAAKT